MSSAHCPVCRDFGSIGYFICDDAMKIWKRCSEHDDQLPEALAVGWHAPTQKVAGAIRRDQFIYNRKIALVERLVKDMLDNGFVLDG